MTAINASNLRNTRRPVDRSLAVAMLTMLAIGNGFIGGFFLVIGNFAASFAAGFSSLASFGFSEDALLAITIIRAVGAVGLLLCGALLHASSIVGKPNSGRFVVSVAVVACILNVAVLGVAKLALFPIATVACVLQTIVAHERARRVDVAST